MVKLLLFLLLLLLLELEAHELDLLLAYGLILHSLALQRFVGILKLLDDLFKFLNALRVDLVLFLLSRVLLDELSLEPWIKITIALSKGFLLFPKTLEFALHGVFTFVPLLRVDGVVLFVILKLILKFEDGFTELLDLLWHFADLTFILRLRFVVLLNIVNFLLFQFLDKLSFFFILLLCLLCQMLDLLHIERLLLVIFWLRGFLNASNLLLLLKGGIHAFCHFLLLAHELLSHGVDLVFLLEFKSFSFL